MLNVTSRILYEFSTLDDPAWTYFDSQHKHIMQSMRDTYNVGLRTVEGSIPISFGSC